jgi:hypothetical protein
MKPTPTVIGLVAIVGALVIQSPAAHADAQSYLAYLQSHGTNTSLWPDTRKVDAGERLCSMLHSGMTPDQIIGSAGFHVVDAQGILDAAQHELCPDTLR